MSRADEPAYPVHDTHNETPGAGRIVTDVRGGLTIREEFAKAAMQGMVACSETTHLSAEQLSGFAVARADALIAELAKPAAQSPDVAVDAVRQVIEWMDDPKVAQCPVPLELASHLRAVWQTVRK